MTEKKRIVITGIGALSGIGVNVKDSWENIINSKSGIRPITRFETAEESDSLSKVAGEIIYGEEEGQFNLDNYVDRKDQKKMDRFIHFGITAAIQAVEDSGWKPEDEESRNRTGIMFGSGIGGLETIQNMSRTVAEKGMRRISPFFIPASLINLISGHVSIKYRFKGPNHATVTACATGTHAIGDAVEIIKRGDADVMLAGGAEAAICELGVGGFSAMHALSTKYNNEPEKASRPWDRDSDGFVMGEGSAAVILEEYEHAKKRGAKIYGEVVGYGLTGDAFHMSAPDETGTGQKRVMRMALEHAGLNPEDIDYINAHGTSTPVGDPLEFGSVKDVFKNCLNTISMSSTKSATGHLLGASGAIEAVFSVLALRDGIMPPTLNLDNVHERCQGIDLVPHKAKEKELKYCLSNSFGFGGTNACLIFKKV